MADKMQGLMIFVRVIIGIMTIGIIAGIGNTLLEGISRGTVNLLGVIILIILGLIFVTLIIFLYFIGYCPRCKLVPTGRILRCLWDRSYKFTFSCPKCNSKAY